MAGNYVARAEFEVESGLYVVEVEGLGTTQAESRDSIMAEVVDFIALVTDDTDPNVLLHPVS